MAARFCPQCGHEQSSAAKFCTNCGASLIGGAATPPPAAATRVDAAARGTRRLLLPLGVAVLVVLVIAVALLAGKLRQESLLAAGSNTPAAPPLTNAPADNNAAPPLTNAADQYVPPAAPLTNASTTGLGQLPPEVAAYVQFLKGIEARRIALANDASGATAMLGAVQDMQANKNNPDADNQEQSIQKNTATLDQGYAQYQQKWQTLFADFRAQAAPTACTDLANKYWIAANDYPTIIGKTQVILDNLKVGTTPDFQALLQAQQVLSQAQHQVNTDLLKADDALTQLCSRYNAPKPFSIQPDGASSSLLGP